MSTTDDPNPCYVLQEVGNRGFMTTFVSPSLGRLALANHLLSAVHCESPKSIVMIYGAIKLSIKGRNLEKLFGHLIAHRISQVRVFDLSAAPPVHDAVEVESISLVTRGKKAASASAVVPPASTPSSVAFPPSAPGIVAAKTSPT